MKRKNIVLFLGIYLIVAVFSLVATIHVTGDAANDTGSSTEGAETDIMNIVATAPFEAYTYQDYLYYGNAESWIYPEAFVGKKAIANADGFSNFVIASEDELSEADAPEQADIAEEEYYEQFTAVSPESLRDINVVVTDFIMTLVDNEEQVGNLWFKIEAAEGYTLPEEFATKPYILHQTYYGDMSSLMFLPDEGMFVGEKVTISNQPVGATKTEEVSVADLPLFFDISYLYSSYLDWYDLGDVSDWNAISDPKYHYVLADAVKPVPISVSYAYNLLVSAEGSDAFYEYFNTIPEDVLALFSEEHKAKIVQHLEVLEDSESIEYSTNANIDGTDVDVSVKGKIPEDSLNLSASVVADEDILNGGFGIKNADDIILALDIKLLNKADGTEWQPEKGYPLPFRSIWQLSAMRTVQLFASTISTGEKIDMYDVFVVEDGKITFVTGSFSIYVVEKLYDTAGTQVGQGNNNITLSIGDNRVIYIIPTNYRDSTKGTWSVTDTTGAIHYTVHSNVASEDIGNGRANARWINIVALKETPEGKPITLTYRFISNNNSGTVRTETYNLYITRPKADSSNGGRRLYIKDTVNSSGTITAMIVDQNGNERPEELAGAAFNWTRNDGLFIVPDAYRDHYQSIDIARDHGGLVEARKKYIDPNKPTPETVIGYQPVTYNLTVTLSDGTQLPASYTVYYQSEIINASFEFPDAQDGTYNFFPNGYDELYWKTTAPGSSTDNNASNLTKDIEYGHTYYNDRNQLQDAAGYGLLAADGEQFAELNAEEFGALYQDIITVPEEYIDWSFAHAARSQQGNTNSMFIVFGPTEQAQTLTTQAHLNDLGQKVRNAIADRNLYTQQQSRDFYNGTFPVTLTYSYQNSGVSATYTVWYHSVTVNEKWSELKGEYLIPEGQYRTRIFFVTDSASVSGNKNYGNMIDATAVGQYKTYLVEYYEETYTEEGTLQLQYFGSKVEKGEALIYSSQPLENFNYFEEEEGDYLHKILINNRNYPYDIRYANTPSIYIEKYPGKSTDAKKPTIHLYDNGYTSNDNVYSEYDLVVQIFFRDTVIAVEKELVLPTYKPEVPGVSEEVPGMTDEQKLTLFEQLNKDGGYKSTFILTSTEDNEGFVEETKQTAITKRDPSGNYKAYVALGNNPKLGEIYNVNEVIPEEDPTGLVLSKVVFYVYRYYMGKTIEDKPVEISYDMIQYDDANKLDQVKSTDIFLGDVVHNNETVSVKIADVTVVNEYVEKMTTIYYEAVGNGKVAIATDNGEPNFQDTPTETLAFYSGKAKGADIFAGYGAEFKGWFLDPECTIPVGKAHGVYDEETGNFKPNSNIIDKEEVTFYAKFETKTVRIERTEGVPNQTYVYMIKGFDEDKNQEIITYATVKCDENGYGYTDILEAVSERYTITEIGGWTWRSDASIYTADTDQNPIVYTFSGEVTDEQWLNGYSESEKNVYTKEDD